MVKIFVQCLVFVWQDDKIHLLLQKRQNTSYLDGFYSTPGGQLKTGEHPTQAMIRELKEELDMNNTNIPKLYKIISRTDGVDTYLDLYYILLCKDENTYSYKNNEPDLCSELKLFKSDQLNWSKINPNLRELLISMDYCLDAIVQTEQQKSNLLELYNL